MQSLLFCTAQTLTDWMDGWFEFIFFYSLDVDVYPGCNNANEHKCSSVCALYTCGGREKRRGFVSTAKKHPKHFIHIHTKTEKEIKFKLSTWGAAAFNNVKVIGSVSF